MKLSSTPLALAALASSPTASAYLQSSMPLRPSSVLDDVSPVSVTSARTANSPMLSMRGVPASSTSLGYRNEEDEFSTPDVINGRSEDKYAMHAPFGLTKFEQGVHKAVRQGVYGGIGLKQATDVMQGKRPGLIDFQVDDQPPSLFVNYALDPDKLDEFKDTYNIPKHIHMVPVACTEGDEPKHYLTLNAYHVTMELSDDMALECLRADWSVYINRGPNSMEPSFLILEAQCDQFTMEPKNIIALPSDYRYTYDDDGLSLSIKTTYGPPEQFSFKAPVLDKDHAPSRLMDRIWIAANDVVYGKGGAGDSITYNGSTLNAPVYFYDPKSTTTDYGMQWDPKFFVGGKAEPDQVFVLSEPALFAVRPWSNIGQVKNPLSHS